MRKVAVVYWSGTGNTEAMAQSVADGAKAAGADVTLTACDGFSSAMLDDYEAVAFGCPAMGTETLEEDEFEPMFEACAEKLPAKQVALFGSYGWGDGEWMRTWEQSCADSGVSLAAPSVICCGAPDGVASRACAALGKALANVRHPAAKAE